MYDTGKYKHKIFPFGERRVIWFFDENEHNAARLLSDNLFVVDDNENVLWQLKDGMGRDNECCVLARRDGDKLYFATFAGFSARLDVQALTISDKQFNR